MTSGFVPLAWGGDNDGFSEAFDAEFFVPFELEGAAAEVVDGGAFAAAGVADEEDDFFVVGFLGLDFALFDALEDEGDALVEGEFFARVVEFVLDEGGEGVGLGVLQGEGGEGLGDLFDGLRKGGSLDGDIEDVALGGLVVLGGAAGMEVLDLGSIALDADSGVVG